MSAVPGDTPVTTPVALTDAVGLVVLQVPPGVASASVMVDASHTEDGPVIGETVGAALTVITIVAALVPPHPAGPT